MNISSTLAAFRARHLRFCALACVVASLVLAACTAMPPGFSVSTDAVAVRIADVLARRGLGQDALLVIDNIVRHEAPPPPAAPPLVRELLAQPLAASDAAALFDRSVPPVLRRLADEATMQVTASHGSAPLPVQSSPALATYLDELATAQQLLRQATGGPPLDGQAVMRELASQPPSSDRLRRIAPLVDAATLDHATTVFVAATARFVHVLRTAGSALQFPAAAVRFESAVGTVIIGTPGDDAYGAGAAVIIDPGGNDVYERAPATDGAVSVIIDLGGDDQYRGSDLVVHGLSAIVDFSGNDRYAMSGPGLGAAIAGISLLLDLAGDDAYVAEYFGQGAAAFGLGALIDLSGNDSYSLRAGGQGFGMAGGIGLLWDRGGNDTYKATGLADAFNRGGGISSAQGAAFGFRTTIGAGTGILRDDAGNDAYEAEMFAQGMGFFYGIGLLWDHAGNDRYRAVRYAQGNGVHEAVGVLRDESGNDHYELTFGVGQGMGLDLAVGVLFDGAGDDRYQSPALAQGTATANGIGMLIDGGGADHWLMGADLRSWGHAQWLRGLPSLGLLIYDPSQAVFVRDGRTEVPPARSAALGGPRGNVPVVHERPGTHQCPQAAVASDATLPLAEGLRRIAPGLGGGHPDPAAYAQVQRHLKTRTRAGIAELPEDSFNISWALGEALHCALSTATPEEAQNMWDDLEQLLREAPRTPFAGAIAYALRARIPPATQAQRMLQALDPHPLCAVRAAALSLRLAVGRDDASRAAVATHARAALHSSCWRLQANAQRILRQVGESGDQQAALPSFLRDGAAGPAGEPPRQP